MGVGIVTDLGYQIIVEKIIPTEREPRNIVNCYMEKGDPLKRRNVKRNEINKSHPEGS